MSLLDKGPVKRVEKVLKDFDQSLEVIVLENSAKTAQDAATALGCDVGTIIKSLLFKTEDSFTLCLVAGDKKCSLNKMLLWPLQKKLKLKLVIR
jgi:prolyl-tRNA editing enzyme YbaK/EbsC (Cys-tRNA(Pro) deacylase)